MRLNVNNYSFSPCITAISASELVVSGYDRVPDVEDFFRIFNVSYRARRNCEYDFLRVGEAFNIYTAFKTLMSLTLPHNSAQRPGAMRLFDQF